MQNDENRMSKRILVSGATGFIGRALCRRLVKGGYEVVALSRDPTRGNESLPNQVSIVRWDAKTAKGWADYAEGAYAIINLAGESIGSGRWTRTKKRGILESRLNAGGAVVEAVEKAGDKPKVVIQASGIGYYGDSGDEIVEESSLPGSGFLSDVAEKWEGSTKGVQSAGVRHVIIRTGVVLGADGGFLSRVILPFRLFVGGRLGSGHQWIPWIHIEDEVGAIVFLMEEEKLRGAFNLTAPNPLTSKEFFSLLGKAMRRPSWLPVPGFALRLFLGEMAKELILSGQRAMPKRLLESGYEFLYPQAELAVLEILEPN
jgi:uncharacterized protein (TIGR01777 family)